MNKKPSDHLFFRWNIMMKDDGAMHYRGNRSDQTTDRKIFVLFRFLKLEELNPTPKLPENIGLFGISGGKFAEIFWM